MRLVLTIKKNKWKRKKQSQLLQSNTKFPLNLFPILPNTILLLSFSSSSFVVVMFPVVAVKIREMHLFAFCRHFCHRVLLHARCPDAYAVRHTPAECIEKWIICNFVFSHSRRMVKEKKAIYICFFVCCAFTSCFLWQPSRAETQPKRCSAVSSLA